MGKCKAANTVVIELIVYTGRLKMGSEGLEPSHLTIQDPKSCVSANFTTSP
jgi:hypothetical protein